MTFEAEEWRPVPSEPGVEASTLGRVRSPPALGLRRYKTGLVVPCLSRGIPPTRGTRHIKRLRAGGLDIRFSVCTGKRHRYVHRLVCEAFHGACPPGQECLHIDEDSSNNNPANLQWGTRQENMLAPGRRSRHSAFMAAHHARRRAENAIAS